MKNLRWVARTIGALLACAPSAWAQEPAPADAAPQLEAPTSPPPAAGDAPSAPAGTAPAPAPRHIRLTGTLGAVSLPRVLSIEVHARFRRANDPAWDLFALGAGIEYLPPGLANFGEKTTLSWFQVGPEGRFFAYRWLFVGARVGWQFSRADSEKFKSEVDYITTSAIVAPKIGALYTFASGLTIGGDLGASIPLFAGTTLESDGQSDANARKAAKTFGMFVMPFLSLRVGWTI